MSRKFEDRITDEDALCKYVTLHKSEYDCYRGAGPCLLKTDGDKIVAIHHLGHIEEHQLAPLIETAVEDGNYWFAHASCYEMCTPVPVTPKIEPTIRHAMLREHRLYDE